MKCETVVKVGRFEWHCMFGSGSCMLYAECIVGVESEVLEDFNLLEFRLQLVPGVLFDSFVNSLFGCSDLPYFRTIYLSVERKLYKLARICLLAPV